MTNMPAEYIATGADKYTVMIGRALFPEGEVNAVDARELHAKLGVQTDFRHWIKRRIEECRFIEGVDFIAVKNDLGGIIEKKDYFLALDPAKHVAMVERNEAGFRIRQYFINFEKKARAFLVDPARMTRLDIAKMLVESEEGRLVLAAKVEADAPKVAGFDVFLNTEGTMTFTEVAKVLGLSGKELTRRLRAGKYLTEDRNAHGDYNNYPRPKYVALGWFVRKEELGNDVRRFFPLTRVTPKGADEIRKLVEEGKL